MKENYPDRIVLDGEDKNLSFEILEEREGVTGTSLVYDGEASDDLFYREDTEDWIEIEEGVYSGLLNSPSEMLDGAVLEYNRDDATAELLLRESEDQDKADLSGYSAVNEGVLTDISPQD